MSDKTYDWLKQIALVILPGVATLYGVFAATWNLPYGDQVVSSIVALDTFLGLWVTVIARIYNKSDARFDGVMTVEKLGESEDGQDIKVHGLAIDGDLIKAADKGSLTVKVQPPTPNA